MNGTGVDIGVFLFCRRRVSQAGRTRLNYVTHFSLGGMWGTAYGIAAAAGLRGQKAANTVFATVYTGDVVLNTARSSTPSTGTSRRKPAGAIFDRFLDPAGQS